MATYQPKSGATVEAYVVTEPAGLQVRLGAGLVTLKTGDALVSSNGHNYQIEKALWEQVFEAAPPPPPEEPPAEEPPPEQPPAEEPPPAE